MPWVSLWTGRRPDLGCRSCPKRSAPSPASSRWCLPSTRRTRSPGRSRSCGRPTRTSTSWSSTTARGTGPPRSPAGRGAGLPAARTTSASAARCAPATATRCGTTTTWPSRSTRTASTTRRYLKLLVDGLDDADIVVGARFAGEGDYRARGPRRWAMRLLAVRSPGWPGTRMTDVTSGFRAANRRAIRVFADHYPAEYLGDTVESLVIAIRRRLHRSPRCRCRCGSGRRARPARPR